MEPDASDSEPGPKPDPRRPANAFILFSRAMRARMDGTRKGLTTIDHTRTLAQLWKDAPEVERAKYRQQAAQLQKQFKEEFPQYRYRDRKRRTRHAVTRGVIPPQNSIFPASTWEIKWDELAPPGEKK
jgi:transcription factor SOX4/11/12 (SOX group C)